MKRIIINTIVLFYSLLAFPQGEANNWYFGYGAGITFNSGSPVAVTDGQLYTFEGCTTISDAAGQLLFYTDGITVYNRNHLMMLNGDNLNGDPSSSQSATIVPKPGSNTLFYVFTVDAEARPNGLQYSIVDISLDGGLGGVTAQKNILIYTPSCEKIGVVKHANNTDFWIVSHGWNNNSFYAHLLTASGLSTTPTTSTIGAIYEPNILGEVWSSTGYLRISPDGSKLVSCSSWSNGTTQLFDFNNASGAVSNPITIQMGTDLFYGAEFSTNNEVLYLSASNNLKIYQFDLNASNLVSSATLIYSGPKAPGALQLGPDGKIYIVFFDNGYLGVVNNPNNLALGCNLNDNEIFLQNRLCGVGLPPFITSFFYTPAIQLDNLCQNEMSTFELNTNQVISSALWNFGDGATSTAIQPNHAYSNPGNYTVSVSVVGPNGTGNNTRNITIYPQPTLLTNTVSLKQCDDNNDGYSAFNLNETIPLLVSNPTGLSITFHETLTQAQDESSSISNLSAYPNQIINNDIVYARIENANGCYKTALINLQVSTTLIPTSFQLTYHECDDALSGSITDGIATFNFSAAESQVRALYPSGQLLDVTFYKNLADALSESNKITSTSNYTNIGSPNTQNIYVRVDSQINNECLGLGHHITLKVDRIPIVQPLIIKQCDDNQDGVFAFTTANLEATLLNGLTNVVVTYADSSGNPIVLSNPFAITSQIITVKVKNNYGKQCEYNTTIQFIVDDLPEAFALPISATIHCDDDETSPSLQNGQFAFDTTGFQAAILGSQTGMIVNYYDQNNNPLPSPLSNPFTTATQNVKVEVINPNNATCKATMTIPFIVNPIPNVSLFGNELVCSNNPTFTKVIDAGLVDSTTINNFTYSWYLNNVLIAGANQYSLTVNTEGTYTVKVTNSLGCDTTRTLNVTASNIAAINAIEVTDLAEMNSITVYASGAGDYVYSIDNTNFQESATFSNLLPGIYTVYVKDKNGCGIATEEVSVLGIPTYFTPNNDGYNDYWNIKGVNSDFYQNASIHIFDRFGKLLKQISPLSQGWDGKYNGQNVPSEDYWYVIKLQDDRVLKGHFALKR
ncbi:T9SS type B sorting domain-containing protein [Flavobacterium sp.]|uniref:T9SS type B sorting domain-containing protein n=1 Tax=Flavobacterium sp. TaxID=239 RepID=UPI0026153240|nr:T9SS type B sorting domain-containing protein [Flavobacterium sp.]